jgi:hypothetical protein
VADRRKSNGLKAGIAAGQLRRAFKRTLHLRGTQHAVHFLHVSAACIGLLSGATALAQVFPESVRGSSWLLVPEIVVLGLLIFWLCRVLFTKAYESPVRDSNLKKSGAAFAAPP